MTSPPSGPPNPAPLFGYTIFHLNLSYSSIEEDDHRQVIRDCYTPLLNLAAEGIPVGLEASALTLKRIAELAPWWISRLREHLSRGECEFLGSGFAQLIGPLVPYQVNRQNLKLGRLVYREMLGRVPRLALVNEQAYSSGLVPLYLECGYEALVMEWDNPARFHPEWDPEWKFLPHFALGSGGSRIPLIWNHSIAFQKFQRLAHGEMELEEYLDYLRRQKGTSPRAFTLYGNDAEIFNFRPGRYRTEPPAGGLNEWDRIRALYRALREEPGLRLCLPGEVLNLLREPSAGQELQLESAPQPVPVKKQGKYNLTRWAVSGRNDLEINSRCWRLFEALSLRQAKDPSLWQELCSLWSSDYRTHITTSRWRRCRRRIRSLERKLGLGREEVYLPNPPVGTDRGALPGRYLELETPQLRVRFNCHRGMALERAIFKEAHRQPLLGTLPHGYYPDIALGADFYSGHVVLQAPGRPQVTDLNPAPPHLLEEEEWLVVQARIPTELGPVYKIYRLGKQVPEIQLEYYLDWPHIPRGSLRLGHLTLNPEAFDRAGLCYRTHNGGREWETFPLAGTQVWHGNAVSFLVSASHCLGLTEGLFEFADHSTRLRVRVDKSLCALVGMVRYLEVGHSYFARLELSAGEMDETARSPIRGPLQARLSWTGLPVLSTPAPSPERASSLLSARR